MSNNPKTADEKAEFEREFKKAAVADDGAGVIIDLEDQTRRLCTWEQLALELSDRLRELGCTRDEIAALTTDLMTNPGAFEIRYRLSPDKPAVEFVFRRRSN
jgi:hypothetical protein